VILLTGTVSVFSGTPEQLTGPLIQPDLLAYLLIAFTCLGR